MANIKRTRRLIKRHKADRDRLKQQYGKTVQSMNIDRSATARITREHQVAMDDAKSKSKFRLEELEEIKQELKSKIASTTYHINSLEIALADYEEGSEIETEAT